MQDPIAELAQFGLVPVAEIDTEAHAVPLGRALVAGGLPCIEVTLRTPAALPAIAALRAAFPDLLVGAGTVLSVAQARRAQAAGAAFIVTPGFDAAVVTWCQANDVPIVPGVMTPTEINLALSRGLNRLKFFPAEAAGGVAALRAIGRPYVGVTFIPTGGINLDNLADYLRLPQVLACGGSFMVDRSLVAAGRFDEVEVRTRRALAVVAATRSADPYASVKPRP